MILTSRNRLRKKKEFYFTPCNDNDTQMSPLYLQQWTSFKAKIMVLHNFPDASEKPQRKQIHFAVM